MAAKKPTITYKNTKKAMIEEPKAQIGAGSGDSPVKGRGKDTPKAYFRAGDPHERTMQDWNPRLQSADKDLLPYRGKMTARARDLVRNNGYAQSIVYTYIDNVVGHFFKISPKPSYVLLGKDYAWSHEVRRNIKARFNAWADSIYYHPDYYRQSTFVQLLKQSLYNAVVDGEVLGVIRYVGGQGKYRLKLQLIEPERLSTPDNLRSDKSVIAGVKHDAKGRPIGYYICDKHPSETGPKKWQYIARTNNFGRKQVIHLYDKERPSQKRGRGIFAPIIQQFKLLDNYKITESERAIAQAMFAAVISSDLPSADAFTALGGELDEELDGLTPYEAYMGCLAEFKDTSGGLSINGSKIAHLATNESLDILRSDAPNTAYGQFTDANVRETAAGAGTSYEQVSKDYSRTTYSSARTAMIEAFKRFMSMREDFPIKLANEIYALWLEEDLELVSGYPDNTVPRFAEEPEAWTACKWITQGKGEIDPLKQAQASKQNLEILRTTHEHEAAEVGQDFDEILEQTAYEQERIKELNITAVDDTAPAPTEEPNEVEQNADD